MRVDVGKDYVKLWLSANDTRNWARKPGAAWPCSQLEYRAVFAEFDSNGLVDFTVDCRGGVDVDVNEFNAITSDFLRKCLPRIHPCYFVCVGQFARKGEA